MPPPSTCSWTTPSGGGPLWRAVLLLALLAVVLSLIGCRTVEVRIIPADRAVVPMPAGQPYTPQVKGWFVPDARMAEIIERGL